MVRNSNDLLEEDMLKVATIDSICVPNSLDHPHKHRSHQLRVY